MTSFFEGMRENILHIFQVSGQKMLTFTTVKMQTRVSQKITKSANVICESSLSTRGVVL